MKFLEYTPFDSINLFLEQLNLGDCTMRVNLEAFSCKHTATDRRLSISLEHEAPVEHLSSRSSQKTMIYLVLTLGHIYPDYDFSAVQAHLFFQEEELESFKQMVDTYLPDASRQWAATNEGSSLLDSMTKAIDEVIKIRECDIYSYNPDSDADPVLEKGSIWSFNYFFYNRKLKRVVSFCCYCTSKLSGDDFLTGAGW
ncbi:repressor of RNA polymerase III transcription MAF1 homolog isoform X1 [Sorghum bicolor]|nr:repressor of RNA polymerase III transcription MAF1 homolog isoform X1 [Sorghum bicolor]|eukprot:XP_021301483.1 repressor of RNA polymerase III transcription MAF1 homolog isoform X1 [Sorghum bicolor]